MRRFSGERGQGVVEFVLASSFAFMLVFGMVDFGRALYAYDAVTSAARIGSRYAIVHGSACSLAGCPASSSNIQSYVLTKITGLDPTQLTVTTTWATAPGCTDANHQGPQCIVKVQAVYTFKFILIFSRTMTMTSTSQMVISQ